MTTDDLDTIDHLIDALQTKDIWEHIIRWSRDPKDVGVPFTAANVLKTMKEKWGTATNTERSI
jgi:hypothetical protein